MISDRWVRLLALMLTDACEFVAPVLNAHREMHRVLDQAEQDGHVSAEAKNVVEAMEQAWVAADALILSIVESAVRGHNAEDT